MEEMMKKGGMESADLFERFQEAGGAPVRNGGTGLCWPLESPRTTMYRHRRSAPEPSRQTARRSSRSRRSRRAPGFTAACFTALARRAAS